MTRSLGLLMGLPVIAASLLLVGCGDAGTPPGTDPADEFWGTEAPSVRVHP